MSKSFWLVLLSSLAAMLFALTLDLDPGCIAVLIVWWAVAVLLVGLIDIWSRREDNDED